MSLAVDSLKVYYRTLHGDVHAVEDVTFDLADGEIMGLAGESGCGKSTLGNGIVCLTGRMKYAGGSVTLDGAELPIWDFQAMMPRRFADVSLIPQYAMSALNPTCRIGRLTADLVKAHGIAYKDVADEVVRRLELVGLDEKVLHMYPIELSGGMKQRVVMVLSTILNPSLLVADEVTSALDVSTQKAVAEMLREFRGREFVKSMIVITHDISILYQVADSILVMYAGQLAEKASAETIITKPRHPYTKALISSLPEVGVRYAEKRLKGIPGTPPGLLEPPTGCRFKDRCPLATAACAEQPPFTEIAVGHRVACWNLAT